MKVRFIKHFIPYEPGDIIWLEDDMAKDLVEKGVVEALDEPKEPEPEPVKKPTKRAKKQP